MIRLPAIVLALGLLTPTATPAQDSPAPESLEEGWTMMEEGARRLFQDLMDGLGPALDGFTKEVPPALQGLGELMGDVTDYQAPEMLPNGDIIIRRRDDAGPPDTGRDDNEIEI